MPTHPVKSEITVGSAFPSLQLSGLDRTAVAIPDAGETVHLQLRRFAGCPVCNLHLRSFVQRADEIANAGIREVVVFHSTPEALRIYESELPFTLVADPAKQIYRQLGVESTPRALLDPRLLVRLPKIFVSAVRGIVGPPHRIPPMLPAGGQLGVPADFLIASDGQVIAVKYGQHAYDQWTVDELLALSQKGHPEERLPAASQGDGGA
jgi:peroxiredoxin